MVSACPRPIRLSGKAESHPTGHRQSQSIVASGHIGERAEWQEVARRSLSFSLPNVRSRSCHGPPCMASTGRERTYLHERQVGRRNRVSLHIRAPEHPGDYRPWRSLTALKRSRSWWHRRQGTTDEDARTHDLTRPVVCRPEPLGQAPVRGGQAARERRRRSRSPAPPPSRRPGLVRRRAAGWRSGQ